MPTNIRFNTLGWLFTIGFIAAMLLPRLVGEGLFGDGLIYASIARNMSIGNGSFWQPFFSSSYYLPYNTGSIFYEHPPLMMGLESLFFTVFGDHFYTEKIYSLCITILILIVINLLWRMYFRSNEDVKSLGWVPLILWYTIPTILWGMPNNMLDNTMALFTLLSAYFILKGCFNNYSITYFLIGSICLLAVFLTKGPVGLFPISIPAIFTLVFEKKKLVKGILYSGMQFILFISSLTILLMFKSPYVFLVKYFDQQVITALRGQREDGNLEWHNHFDILINLFTIQILPPLILGFLIFLGYNKFQFKSLTRIKSSKDALFFTLIGLSGSVPIALSLKQSSFYLIPSTPFFAIGIACLLLWQFDYKINLEISYKSFKIARILLVVGLLIIAAYSVSLFGKISRDEEFVGDLRQIIKKVPVGSKILVSEADMNDFPVHAYFQRYGRYELTKDPQQTNYILFDREYPSPSQSLIDQLQPLKKAKFQSTRFDIFVK